jgi:salicylate hydroxylase
VLRDQRIPRLVLTEQLHDLPDPGALQFWTTPAGTCCTTPTGEGSAIDFLAVVDGQDAGPGRRTGRDRPGLPVLAPRGAARGHRHRAAPVLGLFGQRPLNRWHRGRTVLLGGAAHAMLPHHRQDATAPPPASPPETALRRYAALRRARTRWGQRSSRVVSALLQRIRSHDAVAAAR